MFLFYHKLKRIKIYGFTNISIAKKTKIDWADFHKDCQYISRARLTIKLTRLQPRALPLGGVMKY